ncbi:heterogeneous nuclear ribonucleoprotein K-like [Lytechinus pictus]|uniref:heterogeneous nuclear ribonucleoprotein K-like n=1 Tax=Lytechinus pictus TaxID=7653 RepID=UPI00240DB5CC|nr:heterogeneous nuclear ribonucleoprotein K-like [Lytechinus pictus]
MSAENQGQVSFRILVSSSKAGGVIGKGGHNIKRLREQYEADVIIPNSGGSHRVLQISGGNLENCLTIIKEIIPLIVDEGSGFPVDETATATVSVLVQSSQVGAIIGRGGAKIKELREKTGSNLTVMQDCLPNSTERQVQVIGTLDAVVSALREIHETCSEFPVKGQAIPYDPSVDVSAGYGWNAGGFGGPMGRGGGGMGMRGGRGGRGGRMGPNQGFGGGFGGADHGGFRGDIQTTQNTVPNDLIGAVIGRGGERIRNIRMNSGAEIEIANPVPDAVDRIITIRGTHEQINHAQFLLQQCIRQFGGTAAQSF